MTRKRSKIGRNAVERTMHQEASRARASAGRLTPAKAAAKLRAKAATYYRRSAKLFANDPHGRVVADSDYGSLKWIASRIRAGDLDGAYSYASRLDTLVRDQIPLDVWMYIGGRGVHE